MKLNELNYDQQSDLANLLEAWLSMYTNECIDRTMKKLDEIVSDETTMKILKKLYEAENRRKEERVRDFKWKINDAVNGEKRDCWNIHPCFDINYTDDYRHVLYDLWIREEEEDK